MYSHSLLNITYFWVSFFSCSYYNLLVNKKYVNLNALNILFAFNAEYHFLNYTILHLLYEALPCPCSGLELGSSMNIAVHCTIYNVQLSCILQTFGSKICAGQWLRSITPKHDLLKKNVNKKLDLRRKNI